MFAMVFGFLQRYFAVSPKQGAETSIYLATSNDVATISGKYFVNKKMTASSRASYDYTGRRKLWELSTQLMNAHLH